MGTLYTRAGDTGLTGLFGGTRVTKQDPRVEAYDTVDEANSAIGEAKSLLPQGPWRDRVHHIQRRLFRLAAELASDATGSARLGDTITRSDVADLEALIDACLAITGPQHSFVVPGSDETSAALHTARTVVRRAERRVLALAEQEPVRPELITYLNRLSDAIYAVARLCEHHTQLAQIERIVRAAVARHMGQVLLPRFDLDYAKRLADAAETRADELEVPVVVATVDGSGHPMLLHRMPGSLLASIELAQGKAWTAAAFKTATSELGALATPGGPLPGLTDSHPGHVVLFGGGMPVFTGSGLAGGVGISGGTVEQDLDILDFSLRTVMGVDQ